MRSLLFTSTTWPDRRINLLRALWKEGKSATQIATSLNAAGGPTVTKNSVISKARSVGCAARKSPIKLNDKPGRKPRVLTAEQREKKRTRERQAWQDNGAVPRPANWGAKIKAIRERRAAAIIAPAPATGSMSFSQAAIDNKCMWPYGDLKAGGNVCGGDLAEGSRSWCASHAAVAVHGSKVETGAGDEQTTEAANPA